MLDPQAKALIDLMVARAVPAVHTLSPPDARRFYRERRTFTQPEAPAVARIDERTIAGPHGAVPLRIYHPRESGAPLPTLVYFHGGGWTIGDLDTHDVLCRQLCLGAGVVVVSVDYRLGPEHRFPAAIDDALAAMRWVQGEAQMLGIDASRIALGGDSAGGNIAASLSILLRDARDAREASEAAPAFQLLIYPATDMRHIAPSHRVNGQGYLLTTQSIDYYRGHYLADRAQWTDPRASPLLATNHSGLPPALILTAGFDPLRDEGRQYADALSAAGNAVQYICFERQVHGFITMGRLIDEANTAVDLCAAALRRALSTAAA